MREARGSLTAGRWWIGWIGIWLLMGAMPIAWGAERVALVIGNNAYQHGGALTNAVSDAKTVGDALSSLGFRVLRKQDLSYTGWLDALDELGKAAVGADWAVVYYAGHGIQVQGKNHLIPVDVGLNREGDLRRTVLLDDLLTEVNQARELGLVILDACRDNPFAARLNQGTGRSVAGRGLARVGQTGKNTLVAFATREDTIAADSGVYAAALVQHLATPGLEVERLFGKVRDEVMKRTGNVQQPFTYGSLGGGYYAFKPASAPVPPPAPAPAPTPAPAASLPAPAVDHDLIAWQSAEKCGKPACFQAYLEDYPNGRYARMARAQLKVEAPPPAPQAASASAPSPFRPTVPEEAPAEGSRPQAGQVFRDTLSDGTRGPALVVIPAGEFQMGSPASEPGRSDDERQHEVSVAGFAIGQYEVTFADYDRFCAATKREKPGDEGWGRGQRPVINVSWNDAVAYAEWLSQQTNQKYRLPTEAEWEYTARAGTTTAFWTGRCVTTDQANYDGDYGYGDPDCGAKTGVDRQKTLPVGSFKANPWGLYDTMGNVWEWTCSEWDEQYGGAESRCSTENGITGARAVRGGSWFYKPVGVRSAFRGWDDPLYRGYNRGFRLARSL